MSDRIGTDVGDLLPLLLTWERTHPADQASDTLSPAVRDAPRDGSSANSLDVRKAVAPGILPHHLTQVRAAGVVGVKNFGVAVIVYGNADEIERVPVASQQAVDTVAAGIAVF